MIRWFLATTCLLTSGAALAQEAPPADESAEQQAGIQDIVVTASRREEIAQRSALSIQAISSEELARRSITRPEDLNAIAPGVSIASGGNYPQTYIRGVGNYATNNYAEGAVAYNIDGVYISRGWATRAALFDLDRVEVLKGPQGTLYGRNASGGAINIITARPKLGETSGFVEGEVGNYALWRGAAAINLPIGDTLALRASGQITHRDGYLRAATSRYCSAAPISVWAARARDRSSIPASPGAAGVVQATPQWSTLYVTRPASADCSLGSAPTVMPTSMSIRSQANYAGTLAPQR